MHIAIDPGSVRVSPGGKVNVSLAVRNSGPVVDRYLLTITGLLEAWYTLGSAAASLGPGSEETIPLTIHPPAGEATHAGTYPVNVKVASADDPSGEASAGLTVVVTTAGSVTMNLSPRQAQGRSAIFKATFLNRSNSDATMVLTADDDENALDFRMRPDETVDVAAGDEVTVAVRVRPEERHFVGQPRAYTFTLTAMHEDDPFPVTVDPTLTTKARFTYIPRAQSLSLPSWLWYPIQLIFKTLLILVALFLVFLLLKAIATGGTNGDKAVAAQVTALRATIAAATLTPGSGKAAATAGAQLTAIAQGTKVVLAAEGPKVVATATPTATPSGKGAGSKSGPGNGKGHKTKVPPAPTPNITQFTLIPSGSYVAATWQIDGATSVQLNGQDVPINGAIALPAGASVALLQAFNGKSSVQQALPVPTLSPDLTGGAGGTGDAAAGAGGGAGGTSEDVTGATAGGGAAAVPTSPPPTVTPLPTATSYPTSTPLPTALPTSTALPAPTATTRPTKALPPTATGTPSVPPTATALPTDTATTTATATATSTTAPTATVTASPSATPSQTASPSPTATNTASPSPSPSATDTPTATLTHVRDTATGTPTATKTIVPVPTVTVLSTETITGTVKGTSTVVFRDTVPTSTIAVPSTATGIATIVSETTNSTAGTASAPAPAAANLPSDTPTVAT